MIEIWKDIPQYKGSYQVSNLGRVKSLERKAWNRFKYILIKEKILKESIVRGYKQIMLYNSNKGKIFKVHKLVLLSFIDVCPKNKEINHIDGNKLNNCEWNLEYCTKSENIKHSYRLGLQKPITIKVNQFDKWGNFIAFYSSIKEASEKTKIHRACIGSCINKKQKTAGKFIWRAA